MQTLLNVVESSISEQKIKLKEHYDIRDKLIRELAANNASQIHTEQKIENLEWELKEYYSNQLEKVKCHDKRLGEKTSPDKNLKAAQDFNNYPSY